MENKDLGSKKINGKQESTPLGQANPSAPELQPETETDTQGQKTTVQRARHMEHQSAVQSGKPESALQSKPSTAPEAAGKKMVENKDKNSDITPSRYPNSHPDNHYNRGNIQLEE